MSLDNCSVRVGDIVQWIHTSIRYNDAGQHEGIVIKIDGIKATIETSDLDEPIVKLPLSDLKVINDN